MFLCTLLIGGGPLPFKFTVGLMIFLGSVHFSLFFLFLNFVMLSNLDETFCNRSHAVLRMFRYSKDDFANTRGVRGHPTKLKS